MTTENILLAFALTLIAGLSTGIGGLIAFFTKRDNVHFLTVALGFSAGVMLFVSFVDIFPSALKGFEESLSYSSPVLGEVPNGGRG